MIKFKESEMTELVRNCLEITKKMYSIGPFEIQDPVFVDKVTQLLKKIENDKLDVRFVSREY